MKSVAVIITTRERYAQFLRPMLESVASTNPFGDSWKVGIVAQGYTAKLEETLKSDCDRCLYNLDWDVWFVKDSLGPLDMRSTGLLRWDSGS